jgi:hypothetical protein
MVHINKAASIICVVVIVLFFSGCASNKLSSTVSPHYKDKITPVSAIGVAGSGASAAFPAFVERGYLVKDVGQTSSEAVDRAKGESIPYVALVNPVGTDGA